MVENHVHHDFQSLFVGFVTQAAIFLVAAETGVNLVVVGGGITVVGALCAVVGRIVFKHGGEPQGGDTQLFEIVEVLAYAFEVAAMSQTRLRAVVLVGIHPLDLVVVGAPGGKAVGHEHIQYVGIGEAHALVALFLACLELVVHLGFLFAVGKVEGHGAGLCT